MSRDNHLIQGILIPVDQGSSITSLRGPYWTPKWFQHFQSREIVREFSENFSFRQRHSVCALNLLFR